MHAFFGLHEPVSSLTHLAGAIAFLGMGALLMVRAAGQPRRQYLAIYAASCVLQLAVSGIYHAFPPGAARDVMLRLDLAAIFILIAGTFTAIHGTLLTSAKHRGPLCFVWVIALLGVVLSLTSYQYLPAGCWLVMYLLQGWSGVISSLMIWRRHGPSYVVLPFLGGVVFTIGGFIEAGEQLVLIPHFVGAHELFHLTVLLGMSIFWIYILDAVDIEKRSQFELLRVPRGSAVPVPASRRALADESTNHYARQSPREA